MAEFYDFLGGFAKGVQPWVAEWYKQEVAERQAKMEAEQREKQELLKQRGELGLEMFKRYPVIRKEYEPVPPEKVSSGLAEFLSRPEYREAPIMRETQRVATPEETFSALESYKVAGKFPREYGLGEDYATKRARERADISLKIANIRASKAGKDVTLPFIKSLIATEKLEGDNAFMDGDTTRMRQSNENITKLNELLKEVAERKTGLPIPTVEKKLTPNQQSAVDELVKIGKTPAEARRLVLEKNIK